VKLFGTYGTGGMTAGAGLNGDAPVKNWAGSGSIDMGEEALTKLATFSYDGKYKVKKYACAQCPLSCGAHYRVDRGRWPIGETDRPEYETLAAFGTMTLNHDIESIIKCNDICNKSGLDTISVGATVAWAIECYESGLFSREDTGGIELTWGNAEAIVAATQAVADQNGFGKVLAMGSERAAQALGRGGVFLQNVQGIELPMHDPRFSPRFARTYQCDPTPGRHVKGGLGIVDFRSPNEVKYDYGARAQMDADLTCFAEVRNASGSCSFGGFSMPQDALPRLIAAATGWEFGGKDMLQAGKRIFTMRHAFNLREGQRQSRTLPGRCFGETPLAAGPLKGITVDHRTMSEGFLRCMEWDAQTLIPARGLLEDLGGMEDVIRDLYAV